MYRVYPSNDIAYGDIIFIERKGGLFPYTHYGIYVNDRSVIHFNTLSGEKEIGFNNSIIETDLRWFIGSEGGEVRSIKFYKEGQEEGIFDAIRAILPLLSFQLLQHLFDNRARFRKIYTPLQTVDRARAKLGEKGYNPVLNNCEHFAFWCKTDEKHCRQVERVVNPLGYASTAFNENSVLRYIMALLND